MTLVPAVYEGGWISTVDDAMAEIASTWAVLQTLEDFPTTQARSQALADSRQALSERLRAAGLTEADLLGHLQRKTAQPRTRLHAARRMPVDRR